MAKQFTLGKNERLKSRKEIDLLFSKGKRITVFPYLVFYLLTEKQDNGKKDSLQCGVGAGTKNFKKAVDRNRIKRLTREVYRLQKTALQQKINAGSNRLILFLIYTGKELPDYNFVNQKMAIILSRLITITDENAAVHT